MTITVKQKAWLNTLNNSNSVEIRPFDPRTKQVFKKLAADIGEALGSAVPIVHRGSTSLGISGQGELDIYIPVPVGKMAKTAGVIELMFGTAKSIYPRERIRFVTYVGETKAEIFVINEKSKGWLEGLAFETYLKSHKEDLEAYEKLKEEYQGSSTRQYYEKKIEFFNSILEKIRI